MSIRVISAAFGQNQRIPTRFTRDGQNVSPPIRWENLPEGTRELAVIVEDPDAPVPEPFVHWVAYKIPADAPGLHEGIPQQPKPRNAEAGAQGKNSFHTVGYDGPAPPPGHGVHHYHFRVYALDEPIEVEPKLDNKSLIASMAGHILDSGELVGTYERLA
jgi:Raf kinase inhibitor-like YbhB/YbcL family protein